MKVTKIRDLLLLKRVDFGPKMIRGIYKFDDFWSKSKYENEQNLTILTPRKILEFYKFYEFKPNSMENEQNL